MLQQRGFRHSVPPRHTRPPLCCVRACVGVTVATLPDDAGGGGARDVRCGGADDRLTMPMAGVQNNTDARGDGKLRACPHAVHEPGQECRHDRQSQGARPLPLELDQRRTPTVIAVNGQEDLVLLRLTTKKNELMVVPGNSVLLALAR